MVVLLRSTVVNLIVIIAIAIAAAFSTAARASAALVFAPSSVRSVVRYSWSTSFSMSSSAAGSSGEGDGEGGDKPLFVDIGANLLSEMYQGTYRGKERHEADLDDVLKRAWAGGLDRIIVTGGTLAESREALVLARTDSRLFSTVGVHPTRCGEFGDTDADRDAHVEALAELAEEGMRDGTVVALGELGMDYARTSFCDVETQRRGFLAQLTVAERTGLPLFLHNRETGFDLLDLLTENRSRFSGGVVHSFDDTADLAVAIMDAGLYVGINGCSLKTAENLDVVRTIPLDRMLLETDCPWCDVRASHAGSNHVRTAFPTKQEKKWARGSCIKSRYEPVHIIQVAEVVAGAKGVEVSVVAEASRRNAYKLFGGLQKKH